MSDGAPNFRRIAALLRELAAHDAKRAELQRQLADAFEAEEAQEREPAPPISTRAPVKAPRRRKSRMHKAPQVSDNRPVSDLAVQRAKSALRRLGVPTR